MTASRREYHALVSVRAAEARPIVHRRDRAAHMQLPTLKLSLKRQGWPGREAGTDRCIAAQTRPNNTRTMRIRRTSPRPPLG